MADAPETIPVFTPGPWKTSVAGKRLVWMLACWKTAVASGVGVAPLATTIIEKISTTTEPFGITLHINQPVFESMLPIVIFALLITGHDYAKFKTDAKWL